MCMKGKIKVKSIKLTLNAADWGLHQYNDGTATMLNEEVSKCIGWGFSAFETKKYMEEVLDHVTLGGVNRAPRSVLFDVLVCIYGEEETYDAMAKNDKTP